MNTILVTGGCGFIGRHLVKHLLNSKKYKVIVIDDLSNSYPLDIIDDNLKKIYLPTDVIFEDTINGRNMFWNDNEIEAIYHLGEYSRISPSFVDFDACVKSNIKGTQALIRYWKNHDRININPRLIYAGSSTKFVDDNKNESPYAFSKYMNTELIKNCGKWFEASIMPASFDPTIKTRNLLYNICYFYNVYGPGSKGKMEGFQSVIDVFQNNKLKNELFQISFPGTQERDFTYVGDVVDALFKVLLTDRNCEFHIGSGEAFSITKVAEMINGGPITSFTPIYRLGERSTSLANNKSTKEILDWEPKMRLPDYIEQWRKSNNL